MEVITIFRMTSFIEELLKYSCKLLVSIPREVLSDLLYTNNHSCKKKAVSESITQEVAMKKGKISRDEVEKASTPWKRELQSRNITDK